MNRSTVVSVIIGILIAVSVIHKIRKGAEVLGSDDSAASSRPASSSTSLSTSSLAPAPAPVPTHTPPATSAATGTGTTTASSAPVPASSGQSSFDKITASTDAMLEKVRNDPNLSPTERKLKESKIALMKMQMMQSAAQLDSFRASHPPPPPKSATIITAPISLPAAPVTVPNPDPAPIPAPPPGTKVPSS
ncbi:hypothetical protein SAMN02745166_02280 [Prosthecobacter debontii]|uniref:Uncharacterized protein n=1 Tax=Prosthecobacter debontii TaxID=48467 RepID=A0A1T4Y0G6_9BACT|nr:hypothetical protein [Prosthecobacter debontii]SKA95123.1 hypothetical protein SAMN02745166_02280 [Prosthecobacter debontii]